MKTYATRALRDSAATLSGLVAVVVDQSTTRRHEEALLESQERYRDLFENSSEMIATLVERYRAGDAPLVISDYAGVNAPPMLYDRAFFEELLAMQGEGCGKQVGKRHRSEALSVSWPEEALTDLDVPDDYERVRAMVQSAGEARRDAR